MHIVTVYDVSLNSHAQIPDEIFVNKQITSVHVEISSTQCAI